MKIILYILISIYIYTILKNVISLVYVNKFLTKARNIELVPESLELVYLIIPMLNEQKIAKSTYINFKKIIEEMNNVRVVFVTTSKELKVEGRTTTYEILKELTKNTSNMFVYNYENTTGVMAHQINYAIREIEKQRKDNEKIIIGIYNADSKIDVKTIKYVLDKEKNRNNDEYVCYQQYSWYAIAKNTKSKGIISSASLWQNRWSLTFEILRVKQQEWLYKNINKLKMFKPIKKIIYVLFEKMNYVIGHGFYMDIDLLKEIGGIPENTINEDAFLGYIVNNKNIKIDAIPYLEKAEFAPTTSIYIKQQTTWVNGPIYAFEYFSIYKNSRQLKISERIRAFVLAIKLFLHFVYWVLSPYILIFMIPILLYGYYSVLGLVMASILILLELPFTHYLVRKIVLLNVQEEEKCEVARPSIYCVPFFIIHSFGAIRNLYMQVIGKNKMENKYKTERE